MLHNALSATHALWYDVQSLPLGNALSLKMPPHNIIRFLGIAYLAMAIGSVTRLIAVRRADPQVATQRLASLKTWWALLILLTIALLAGLPGICGLMGLASLLAMWELNRLVATRRSDAPARWVALLLVPMHYGLIASGHEQASWVFLPVAGLLAISIRQVLQGETQDYVRSTAGLFWGLMVLCYGLAHVARLTTLSIGGNGSIEGDLSLANNSTHGPIGWFLFVVVLTQTNDISQALVGRRFGAHKKHRITPRVSPNKTWEGFLGGLLITVLLATTIAPWLTPWNYAAGTLLWGTLAGALIAVSGFFGDINMSAVKRDAGVKDSGHLLPGMGGVIDRVDSLSFSGPVFYYYILWILRS